MKITVWAVVQDQELKIYRIHYWNLCIITVFNIKLKKNLMVMCRWLWFEPGMWMERDHTGNTSKVHVTVQWCSLCGPEKSQGLSYDDSSVHCNTAKILKNSLIKMWRSVYQLNRAKNKTKQNKTKQKNKNKKKKVSHTFVLTLASEMNFTPLYLPIWVSFFYLIGIMTNFERMYSIWFAVCRMATVTYACIFVASRNTSTDMQK